MHDEALTSATTPEMPGKPADPAMRQHVLAFDWSATPLGVQERWPESLRIAVDHCLDAGFPALILWGDELIQIYNDAAALVLGPRHPGALGQPARQTWADVLAKVEPRLCRPLRGGGPVVLEALHVPSAGGEAGEAWFTVSCGALRDAGRVVGLQLSAVDISARVRAEAARRIAERRLHTANTEQEITRHFRALFEAAPTPFLVLTVPDYRIIAVNDAFLRASTSTREELLGQRVFQVFANSEEEGGESLRNLRASLDRAASTGRPDLLGLQRYPLRRTGPGAEERWWTITNRPVPGQDGRTALIIHRVEDVSELVRLRLDTAAQDRLAQEQLQTLQRLRESEERYRTLFESIDEGFCVITMIYDEHGEPVDYRFEEVNPAFGRQTGLENVVGRTMREIAPEHDEHWFRIFGEIARTGTAARFEERARVLGRDYDVYACRVGAPAEHRVAIFFNDITERRRTEAELHDTQQRLEEALRTARMAWWTWDPESDTGSASDSLAEVFGIEPGGTLGGAGGTLALMPEEDRVRQQQLLTDSLAAGKGWTSEYRIMRPRDGQIAWLEDHATLVRDPETGHRHVTGLVWDITERKRAEIALRDADRRKNEFLATLAHELRNPLAPLRNGLQIARLAGATDNQLQPVIAMMERQLSHLVRLVDDLLDLGRITAGKVELRREVLRLGDVLASSVEATRGAVEEHGHTLHVTVPPEPLWVHGDFDRLAQVFSNLLSNAAKYTDTGGHIEIALQDSGGEAVVKVRDTGIGIPAEDLSHVFDLFSQVRKHQGHAEGGLGIGLALVRNLVAMHGGEVTVQSEGPGKGSTFTVRLPLAAHTPVRPAARIGVSRRPGSAHRRVLIADDNVDAAESLALLLELDGHEVMLAHDGRTAVALARERRPDLAILDIGMPVMDGIEAGRRMRAEAGEHPLTLVALTGWGQEEDRRRTREAGFDAHLVKPVDPAMLDDLLREPAPASGGHP